jgi:hypothetical protein
MIMCRRDQMAAAQTPLSSVADACAAFHLEADEAGALWQTPTGVWVVVARGQVAPYILNDLAEWQAVACEDEVALTADPDGHVRRHGSPMSDDPAWVVPDAVRAQALS